MANLEVTQYDARRYWVVKIALMNPQTETKAFSAIVKRLDPSATYCSHRPLVGGVSAEIHAVSFKLATGDSEEVVVRRNGAAEWKAHGDDVALFEYELHAALFEAGLPVPEPLLHDATGELLPSPYMVMAMVDGDMIVDLSWLPAAIEQMADFLLHLHAFDISSLNLPARLPRDEDPVAGALTYIPDTDQFAALRTAVENWQVTANKPTLLHGDFWPNNVLWKNQQIAAVIDWEDAAIGTPLVDLACARCEILTMFDTAAMDTFTARYCASTTADLSDLPLWEVYASYAALASMGDWGLSEHEEAHRREATTQFAERAATEVLQRAL